VGGREVCQGADTESAGVAGHAVVGAAVALVRPAQEPAPAPGQSASVLHGPPLFVPALQSGCRPGTTGCPVHSGTGRR